MITVAWTDYGTVQGEFCISIARSIKQDSKERDLISDIFAIPCSAVALGRNAVFRDFLEKTESPWLLMVDADTIWSAEDIYKLYDIATKNDIKVLSGTYFVRINCLEGCLHTVPALFINELKDNVSHTVFLDLMNNLDKEIVELTWTGLGALLIHRDVLEDTKETSLNGMPYWCAEALVDGNFSGEDHYFFNVLNKKGYKVYGTPQVLIGHVKKYVLDLEFYKEEHGYF